MTTDFEDLWDRLATIGRLPSGATERLPWTDADRAAREWFMAAASERGMPTEVDRNGNLWAWWPAPGSGAIATGSHLDSVPGGGAWDGALGVVSAFLAVDMLRERRAALRRPIAVVSWAEEEGARFGVATLGSRLTCGVVDPVTMLPRTDQDDTTFEAALRASGVDAHDIGPDPERLSKLSAFVELHVEQGRALAELGPAIATATRIRPHGRWRVTLDGAADHAGTARLDDRHDPTIVLARLIDAARRSAVTHQGVATVGRVVVRPNGSNVVPAQVVAWLDVRADDEDTVRAIVTDVHRASRRAALREGVRMGVTEESWTSEVRFDESLRARIERVLTDEGIDSTPLATAAGHDAGILAASLPTAMLFVRNPTGVSHAPDEGATLEDALTGVGALAAVLADLASVDPARPLGLSSA